MAMEGARYTIKQLKALRESPLVRKPDELPSIDKDTMNAKLPVHKQPSSNIGPIYNDGASSEGATQVRAHAAVCCCMLLTPACTAQERVVAVKVGSTCFFQL